MEGQTKINCMSLLEMCIHLSAFETEHLTMQIQLFPFALLFFLIA